MGETTTVNEPNTEASTVNLTLVRAYDDLSNEDPGIRLKAAQSLLEEFSKSSQKQTILTRLFRGLCSGRKAARLGFAIALTEALSQLDETILVSQVIDILETQTRSEGNSSGQIERDHYFGRLFGSEAIIESGIIFSRNDLDQWDHLLNILCTTSLQKPWLRQGCGWCLYRCAQTSLSLDTNKKFAVRILEKLSEHKLIRTPEGLAIWIAVRHHHPLAKLPKHVWKENDPLTKKDLQTVAKALKDAKLSSKDETEPELQGSASWSANIHFVWDVVLDEVFGGGASHDAKRKEFAQQFWQSAVDDALFASTNSPERKHWGLLVLQRALKVVSPDHVEIVLSKNATSCLMQSLKSPDRYLQRSTQAVIETLRSMVELRPLQAPFYILGLFKAAGLVDFDTITQTKTMEELFSACKQESLRPLAVGLNEMMPQLVAVNADDVLPKLRLLSNYQSKVIWSQVNYLLKNASLSECNASLEIVEAWIKLISRVQGNEPVKTLLVEKVQSAFENLLKVGQRGRLLTLNLVRNIHKSTAVDQLVAEDDVIEFVNAGWERFVALHEAVHASNMISSTGNNVESINTSMNTSAEKAEGIALLYGLILFEIYSGDAEAVQILQELLDSESNSSASQKPNKSPTSENVDALIETLLSFASRPSKFLRRLTLIIFDTITTQITRNGIRSLTDVVRAKETKAGQQELFQANGDIDMLDEDEDEDEEKDSDVEMLDSDVEVVSGDNSSDEDSESESESGSDSVTDRSSESGEDDTDVKDTELLALEASLASALGTRKLTQADMDGSSSSDSDSDMTDSEMMALDNKLAEVFRNRAASSNQTKKKEQKNAKENIINFKNRVLDMLDIYIRREYLNPRSLDLILPLLQLSRSTNTKQLADRAIKLLQAFTKRCVGLDKVPTIPVPVPVSPIPLPKEPSNKPTSKSKKKDKPEPSLEHPNPNSITSSEYTPTEALSLLHQIHIEAGLPNVSNAHRAASSKTSILVVKTLLKAGVPFSELSAVYDRTEKRTRDDPTCHVQKGFFEEWETWTKVLVEKGKIKM